MPMMGGEETAIEIRRLQKENVISDQMRLVLVTGECQSRLS